MKNMRRNRLSWSFSGPVTGRVEVLLSIELQHGLAVFRQAMTITINPKAGGRRYSKADIRDTSFSNRCHGESWEVPVVEIIY